MSGTTSADPDRLDAFVSAAIFGRVGMVDEQAGLSAQLGSVTAASPDYRADVPAVAGLADLLDAYADDERFVATIRDALIEADASTGAPIVPDEVISLDLDNEGVGTPMEQVEIDPVTVLGLPPTSGYVDDPICAANGNMVHQDTDLVFPAIAAALDVTRTWNSLAADRPGVFGPGWSSVLDVELRLTDDRAVVRLADGAETSFVAGHDGAWRSIGRRGLELVGDTRAGWRLRTDPIRTFDLDRDGRLTGWSVGVAAVAVRRDAQGRIVGLSELVTGRAVTIDADPGHDDVIGTLTADDGRSVSYARDDAGHPTLVSSAAGWLTYEWDGDLLAAVVDPDGVAPFRNTYDAAGRVVRQVSPFGRATTYRYGDDGRTVITGPDVSLIDGDADADGIAGGDGSMRQAMVHDGRGNLTAVVDLDGHSMRFTYDRLDRVTSVVERDGARWRYLYDERGDLVERVDPDGLSHRWEWDERHRIVTETDRAGAVTRREYDTDHHAPNRVVDPCGAVVSQVLDERGLPVSITDPDGVTIRFEYDGDGQLVRSIDGVGRPTTVHYDETGHLVGVERADGSARMVERDAGGRVVRVADGGLAAEYDYTPAGRVRAGREPGGLPWSATFGPHGAVDTVTDAVGATIAFEHDLIGNVAATVAADGARSTNRYDAVGRLVSASDPIGATVGYGRDVVGRVVTTTDPEGATWSRELDVLGRTVASTDPVGATTRWTYHRGGEAASVTTPDGRVWHHEIDAAGRPTAVVDPTGARSTVEYTPGGRPLRRTSPAGRVETYEYDGSGELSAIVGPDDVRRVVHRDAPPLAAETRVEADGRVVVSRDATGATTTFEYDARGLLARAVDPAGLATTYAHDERGRLAEQVVPGDRTTTFAYGSDGRLATTTDSTVASVGRTHDLAGRTVSLRHADGTGWDRRLDPLGREVERTTPDGTPLAAHEYDAAGRLARSWVPEGVGADTFLWDDADRLVAVERVDGTTTIERDVDGWVVATTDADGHRTEYERDPLGRIVSVRFDQADVSVVVPSAEPDRVERDLAGRLTIAGDGTLFRYDDAGRLVEVDPADGSGPTTFGYSADGLIASESGPSGRRRFAHDDSGRVVSIAVDGVGVTTVGYDTVGRRVAEHRPDGSTVTYRWDAAGRLASIDGPDGEIEISYDAHDRPVQVGSESVSYDPVSGEATRVGDTRMPSVGSARYDVAAERWLPSPAATPMGGVPVGHVFVVGARVLDPTTHQFLSPDPLLPVAGSNGAASAYTYAWNDPVNHADPSGLRPIGIEEAEALRTREELGRVGQAWEAVKEDPWGTVAMGAVIVGATAIGGPVGASIAIGMATTAGVGLATGTFSPRAVAVSGVFSAVPGLGPTASIGRVAAVGATTSTAESITQSVVAGNGFPPPRQLIADATVGAALPVAGRSLPHLTPQHSTAAADHSPTPTGLSQGGGAPNETYFRTMSEENFAELQATGRLPATGETFISPSAGFSSGYDGQMVEFSVRPGTTESLAAIGVRDESLLVRTAYPDMPPVSRGWGASSAYFKGEGDVINIGLGHGDALDTFNDSIQHFEAR